MKVVFDANILVSALVFPGGAAKRHCGALSRSRISLLSPSRFSTTCSVSSPGKFSRDAEELSHVAVFVSDLALFVKPRRRLHVVKDEPDYGILECALAGRAEVIVTGDHALLQLRKYDCVRIISLLRRHPVGAPLKRAFTKGFVYSDGRVDDARLVVLNAIEAAARGATILTRWRCVEACRSASRWQLRLENLQGAQRELSARALVNAAGPRAAQFLGEHAHLPRAKTLRLVKSSHVVVSKLFDHDHAYIFQNPDKRVIFAILYKADFTLIGTTDFEHHGPVGEARIDAAETAYLCEQASRHFERPVTASDVVWSNSGVRPLLDDDAGDPAAVTRDYLLELDRAQAPPLTIQGGKITTFRKLAEEAADLVAEGLAPTRWAWTRAASLPGGDLSAWIGKTQRSDIDFMAFSHAVGARLPALPAALRLRLARAYGSRIELVLTGGLGAEVAAGLHEAELNHLHRHEWARSADDVVWRHSKLGLHYSAAQRGAVADWCAIHWPRPAARGAARQAERAWS